MRKEKDSDSHLGYWIFLVGCWIFKKGGEEEVVVSTRKSDNFKSGRDSLSLPRKGDNFRHLSAL